MRQRGVELARRRGGGGAVYLEPARQLWLDAWIPRDDPLWVADVSVAAEWVGAWWVDALARQGQHGFDVHAGRSVPGEFGELVCFAGRGPGEVFHGGRKVVGLSQWRAREGALFSSCAYLRWDPEPLLELLYVDERVREELGRGVTPAGGRPGRARARGRGAARRARRSARIVSVAGRRLAARRRDAGTSTRLRPLRPPSAVPPPRRPLASRRCRRACRRSGENGPVPAGDLDPGGPWPAAGRRSMRTARRPLRGAARRAGSSLRRRRHGGGEWRGCVWVAGGVWWLCSGGKWRKVVRNGVTGRQRTQTRERRGR